MDLRSALNAAVSSLTATQYQISVAASNIANASVEGYTAKSANLATTITSGNATGVSITSVDRYTNANLFNTLLDQTGDTAYLETLSTYLGAAVDSFGSTESNSSISHLLTELETAVAELAVSPESDSLKTMVIEAAVAVADSCQSMSSDIQSQRAAADSAIEVAVDELNAALETIDELNEQISRRTAMGQSTGDLEDARDQALLTVSQYLDVNAFYTANNTLQIYTDDGLALVDSQAHTLEYTAAGGMSASTTYPGTISGIMLDGKDITTRIDDGTIGALIAVRDTELPALQAELDTLATALADSVNAALSEGATYPGADTLTSTTAVDAADAFSGTGTVRIAVVDGDGMTVEFADLDLSTFSTMQGRRRRHRRHRRDRRRHRQRRHADDFRHRRRHRNRHQPDGQRGRDRFREFLGLFRVQRPVPGRFGGNAGGQFDLYHGRIAVADRRSFERFVPRRRR